MLKAEIRDRVTINNCDWEICINVDFEAVITPAEEETNVHEDIEVTEVYDDYKVTVEHSYTDDLIKGGKSLLFFMGFNIKDLLENHISEYYEKYKKQLQDYED